jgi:sugar-specific transcriptional regulator TrmB
LSSLTEQIVSLLKELEFNDEEIEVYLYILRKKEFVEKDIFELGITENKTLNIIEKFKGMGLIIEGTNKKFKCLHPRMGITNVYKILEEKVLNSLKEKRKKAELLVRFLTSYYEK